MNKTLAIIQARMSSSRLPGKVLTDIAGKPLIEWLVRRMQQCSEIDEIVVATSTNPNDDVLEQACQKMGVHCFRGNEDDVLDRFMKAAEKFGGETIVRLCSDAPMTDPKVTDMVIRSFKQANPKVDFVCNHVSPALPHGVDTQVFSLEALKKTYQMATQPYQRSHVTLFMRENPEIFKILNIHSEKDYYHMRWVVDTAEDLEFARQVISRVAKAKGDYFGWQDVLEVLEKNPELQKINKDIRQKDAKLG